MLLGCYYNGLNSSNRDPSTKRAKILYTSKGFLRSTGASSLNSAVDKIRYIHIRLLYKAIRVIRVSIGLLGLLYKAIRVIRGLLGGY